VVGPAAECLDSWIIGIITSMPTVTSPDTTISVRQVSSLLCGDQ
jgi:hypothetical protein